MTGLYPGREVDPTYLIEEFMDHIVLKYELWMLDGHEPNEKIWEFVEWCVKEGEKELHIARAPDGKSFLERTKEYEKWLNLKPSIERLPKENFNI